MLGLHYGVPVIVFGAAGAVPAQTAPLAGGGALLTILHERDPLAYDTTAGSGYRRLGRIVWIGAEAAPGLRHDLAAYRAALETAQAAGVLPAAWP